MKNKINICNQDGCSDKATSMGRCENHYNEYRLDRERRDMAVRTLHSGDINGELLHDAKLQNELFRLIKWWGRICDVINHQKGTEIMPLDEAESAKDWCISLANEIIDADRTIHSGNQVSYSFEETRSWVWDRFRNLEAGLQSNGVKRNSGK